MSKLNMHVSFYLLNEFFSFLLNFFLNINLINSIIDRKKVLKHHPDKKASSGNTNDDDFFKCIQKGL